MGCTQSCPDESVPYEPTSSSSLEESSATTSRRLDDSSRQSQTQYAENIYELVITLSRYLETLLQTRFGATGKGLHEKVNSVEKKLTPGLIKNLRFLASVRNQLVHEEHIPNQSARQQYIESFERAREEMQSILNGRGQRSRSQPPASRTSRKVQQGRSRSATRPSRTRR